MRIFVDLLEHEVRMVRVMAKLQQDLGCSPKKWRVVAAYRNVHRCSNADAQKTFCKLVLVEVIQHRRNGHCWLTDKGAQALLSIGGLAHGTDDTH